MTALTVDDVAALALALPGVAEGTSFGNRAWFVGSGGSKKGRHFAWQRPFSKADVRRFGDSPVPAGDILAVRLADEGEKAAVLAGHPGTTLTIPHLDGHPIVLVMLAAASETEVRELLEDGWLAAAPAALADDYVRRR